MNDKEIQISLLITKIDELEQENARLREALELIEESCEFCGFEYARKVLEKSE